MSTASAIQITDLRKVYAGPTKSIESEALKGITLTIPKGSFFGLLGPNGAGKSTIINIIAGLALKTSGSIKIMDYDMDELPMRAKYCVGVVPQEVVLDPFFSIYESLEYHAGYYGVPKSQRKTKEILEALHLTDKKDVSSRRLSGGMKRRVLIAKALVHTPPILILDEPTAGVDVELRQQLWEYVRMLNKNGTTILLTTHYLEEAEQLCDQIAIINHGEIIAREKTSKMMKILEDKRVTIRFSQKIDSIPVQLAKFDAKTDGDDSITINYKSGQAEIGRIIESVKEAGLEIKDISTLEPNLEDIFRHLTNKKV